MKDFTRVCRIEPQAVGAWLKQTPNDPDDDDDDPEEQEENSQEEFSKS
jgi:hypothetical protein